MSSVNVVLGESVELEAGTKASPFQCQECGERFLMVFPVSIDTMCSLAKWFEKKHANCGRQDRQGGPR